MRFDRIARHRAAYEAEMVFVVSFVSLIRRRIAIGEISDDILLFV
jgi:hypothetical protein